MRGVDHTLRGCAPREAVFMTYSILSWGATAIALNALGQAPLDRPKDKSLPLAIASPLCGEPASQPRGGMGARRGSGLRGPRGGLLAAFLQAGRVLPSPRCRPCPHTPLTPSTSLTCAPTWRYSLQNREARGRRGGGESARIVAFVNVSGPGGQASFPLLSCEHNTDRQLCCSRHVDSSLDFTCS